MPAAGFTTVVTQIENTLLGYEANPNTVIIANVLDNEQPSVALANFNQFANSSDSAQLQACKVT